MQPQRFCPQCGHELIKPSSIGLSYGGLICPMNMPFGGCGYWTEAKSEDMAHHKRRRPKHQHSGCLLCKPHKDERLPKTTRYKGMRSPRKAKNIDKVTDY